VLTVVQCQYAAAIPGRRGASTGGVESLNCHSGSLERTVRATASHTNISA